MTALDGDPLTGDPTDPDVRWLLKIIPARAGNATKALSRVPAAPHTPVPVIHEPCGLGQCGGCTARGCRTRANTPAPVPVDTPRILTREQALTRTPWYDTDHIDGSNS